MTLQPWLFALMVCGFILIGIIVGWSSTKDIRKYYDKEYEMKCNTIRQTISKETKNEWSNGWDACAKCYSNKFKMLTVYLREHNISDDDLENFYKEYMDRL